MQETENKQTLLQTSLFHPFFVLSFRNYETIPTAKCLENTELVKNAVNSRTFKRKNDLVGQPQTNDHFPTVLPKRLPRKIRHSDESFRPA